MDKKGDKVKVKKKLTMPSMVLDVFTGEEIPRGYVVKTTKGPIHKKYALFSKTTGKSFSSKDDSIVIDYNNQEPIQADRSYCVIVNINTKGQAVVGYTMQKRSLISMVGIRPSGGKFHSYAQYADSIEIAKKLGLKESVFDGVWYKPSSVFKPSESPIPYKEFGFPHINKASKKDLLKYGIVSPTYRIAEGKKYSMGIELETSGGNIPSYVYNDLNIKCVYDGSIRDDAGNKRVGGEYVTGVLRGDNGFRHLYKIVNELSKRCSLNKTCSVHVHLGGLKFTKAEIVMLWKINQLLEAELYSMMPKSRLSRAHCRQMQHITFKFNQKNKSENVIMDEYYNKIFKIVSLGKTPSKTVNKKFNHPAGHSCGYDTSTPRYWWINFIPAMFNLKGLDNYTIEYRMHSASLNFSKIKTWILICMGITYVAENHQKFVMNAKKITLKEVMKLAFPTKWKYLNDYIEERKIVFSNLASSSVLNERAEYIVDRNISPSKSLRDTVWD